jgi:hypothetical protein
MTDKEAEIEAVLHRVEETLQTAMHGLDDVLAVQRDRRMSGLRNLIVFGRSVTFVLQNLRSVVDDGDFDAWYTPRQEAMKASPLMRYLVYARSALEKQGKLSVATGARLNSLSTNDIKKFGRPPANARSFFIGDQLGGTGWEVELPDGSKVKYYVELPTSVGEVKQQFSDFPVTKALELADRSVEDLCRTYVAELTQLVAAARNRFISSSRQADGAKRRATHLRLVK